MLLQGWTIEINYIRRSEKYGSSLQLIHNATAGALMKIIFILYYMV